MAILLNAHVGQASPATFTVNSTGDAADASAGDGVCETATAGECTLRAAIQEANALAGADTVTFNVPGAGPHTIQPASSLSTITEPVTIDGYTQLGSSPNTLANGNDAALLIELDGTNAGSNVDGLRITAGSSTVRGLAINRFSRDGIRVETNGGNVIQGNFIGTDVTGTTALFNSNSGVSILNAPNNTIGGTTPGARNVISSNSFIGLHIRDSSSNLIQGNFIGTTADGASALGNGSFGILITNSPNNTIGGTTPEARNIISGNGNRGLHIEGSGTGNVVQGNFIGTDVTGTVAVGNTAIGIIVVAPDTVIGGTTVGAGNVISGNGGSGINISSGGPGALIQGNFIGTDLTGTADLGNATAGIVVGGGNNTIGGTTPEARNIISGNGDRGIIIVAPSGTGNVVQGNFIGIDVTGTVDLGNSSAGILLSNDATNNTIGGTTPGAGNIISGNVAGISIVGSGVTGNLIQGNFIGTDVTGTLAIPNSFAGVGINGPGNIIGGTTPGARNVISGNGGSGVGIDSGGTGTVVQDNLIGTQVDGVSPLGNGGEGVLISSSGNSVGGTVSGAENTIAFNNRDGVFVSSGTGSGVLSNSIHSNGGLGIDLHPPKGVTPNDQGDGDSGANNLQNFPVVTSSTSSGGSTVIEGTLNSTANTTFSLEFFANAVCDPSGHGEGQTFLGSANVTADGSGNVSFSETLPVTIPAGQDVVTATTTDPSSNTSEFSACITAVTTVDSDGDGVVDDEDACPTTPGLSDRQGCPVGDENLVELHVIDQAKSGACPGGAGSCKSPVQGAAVKVFDRNKLNGVTIKTLSGGTCSGSAVTLSKNPDGSLYDDIYECAPDATLAASLGCVTDANGFCTAGEEAIGDYLVIVKHVDGETSKTVYTGKPKSPEDFSDTDGDGAGDLARKDFQVIKIIKKDGTVQFVGGSKTVVIGSYLEIIYSDYAIWEEAAAGYIYPFIFSSDSDWTVDVCVQVPEGYEVIGAYDENGELITDSSCAQTFVSGKAKVIAFEVEEVGSPEPVLGVRLTVEHGGKVTTLDIEVPGHRTYVDGLPAALPATGAAAGASSPWWLAAVIAGGLAAAVSGGIVLWRRRRA